MQIAQKNFYKKFLGRAGEIKAAEFLKEKGYKILQTNYRTIFGEADIIAEKDQTVIFVEVKTRTSDAFGLPSEAVVRKKQEKYFKIATEYTVKYKKTDCQIRFDVVEIENGQINHIFDAFSV